MSFVNRKYKGRGRGGGTGRYFEHNEMAHGSGDTSDCTGQNSYGRRNSYGSERSNRENKQTFKQVYDQQAFPNEKDEYNEDGSGDTGDCIRKNSSCGRRNSNSYGSDRRNAGKQRRHQQNYDQALANQTNEHNESDGFCDTRNNSSYERRNSYGGDIRNNRGKQERYKQNYDQAFANQMDEETTMYFEIVYERMHEPFENDEERDIFVENVVEQMKGKEEALVSSSLGNKTIQKILELNTQCAVINMLIVAFQKSVESLSSDQYGSLTLQSLLTSCLKYLDTNDDDVKENIVNFILKVAEFCLACFPDIVDHPFQNYIFKTVIHVLSGNSVFHFKRNQFECQPMFVEVPPIFQETLYKVSERILSVEQFEEYLQTDTFSFHIQHLLKASSHFPDIAKHISNSIFDALLKYEESKDEIHPLLTGVSSSHAIESAIEHFDSQRRKLFVRKYILKNLEKIIQHKQANNVLKTLIWKTKKMKPFLKLFDKLEPYFKLIFRLEHDTILVALADGCIRFDICQARFVTSLKDMLECSETESQNYFVLCVLHMLMHDQYVQAESENTVTVSLNGSLLVQRLLCFSKPIRIAMAIVNMSLDTLKRICCDPKGCHIIDAFMSSKFVGEKSRDKLIEKVKEIAITLACTPHGSRCIDAIWENASLKQKIMMADSLIKNEEILSTSKFGKFVRKNLALYYFKNRFEEWKQVQTSQDKKRKMFQGLLDNNQPNVKKRKTQKLNENC